jgi:hypothetical protein
VKFHGSHLGKPLLIALEDVRKLVVKWSEKVTHRNTTIVPPSTYCRHVVGNWLENESGRGMLRGLEGSIPMIKAAGLSCVYGPYLGPFAFLRKWLSHKLQY